MHGHEFTKQDYARIALVAGAVGAVAAGWAINYYWPRPAVLSSEDRIQACQQANIGMDDRSGTQFSGIISQNFLTATYTTDGTERLEDLAATYYPANTALGLESLTAANPTISGKTPPDGTKITIPISNIKRERLAAGESLYLLAERRGYDVSALECLNGIYAGSRFTKGVSFQEATKVAVPAQGAGDDLLNPQVIKAGESYPAGAQISPGSVPADKLQAGDIVYTNKDGIYIQPTESYADQPKIAEFIAKYGPLADRVQQDYGVPAEVTLAQAARESVYATAKLASEHHNYFGIKAGTKWHGAVAHYETHEEIAPDKLASYVKATGATNQTQLPNGNWDVTITDTFRAYDSDQAGFLDYGKYLRDSGFYDDAFQSPQTPESFIDKLVDGTGPKYATDSSYAANTKQLVHQIQLSETATLGSAYQAAR